MSWLIKQTTLFKLETVHRRGASDLSKLLNMPQAGDENE